MTEISIAMEYSMWSSARTRRVSYMPAKGKGQGHGLTATSLTHLPSHPSSRHILVEFTSRALRVSPQYEAMISPYLIKIPAFALIMLGEKYAFTPPKGPPPTETDKKAFGNADTITRVAGWAPFMSLVRSPGPNESLSDLTKFAVIFAFRPLYTLPTFAKLSSFSRANTHPMRRRVFYHSSSILPPRRTDLRSLLHSLSASFLSLREGGYAKLVMMPWESSSRTNSAYSRTTNSSPLARMPSSATQPTPASSQPTLDSYSFSFSQDHIFSRAAP